MQALKIACVGEAMIELSIDKVPGSGEVGVAGDVLNAAIYLVRGLSTRHEVSFVSVIGTDPLSNQMANFIAQEGISIQTLLRDPARLPGIYVVNTDKAGERSFLYWRESSAARRLFQKGHQISFDILEGFDVIYLSGITLAILPDPVRAALFEWIEKFRTEGGRFAFDSNYRPRLWSSVAEARQNIEQAWRLCDIALPSLDDELELFGDADETSVLERFRSYGVPFGALKRASKGPIPINATQDESLTFIEAKRVVDTTAAGDSFVGAFLASHLTGGTLSEALMSGHNCAATVVGHKGAILRKI